MTRHCLRNLAKLTSGISRDVSMSIAHWTADIGDPRHMRTTARRLSARLRAIYRLGQNPGFQLSRNRSQWPAKARTFITSQGEGCPMFNRSWLRVAGLVLGGSVMLSAAAGADPLKDEIAPTGKLRVGIGISAAGGAYWSNKNEAGGYTGVPVDLGKEMAAQLGVQVEYVTYPNSGQITDAASTGAWDVTFLPQDAERETKMLFGPVYEVADATYIVKAGSMVTTFATLDPPGI